MENGYPAGTKVESINIQPPASIYGTFARYNYTLWYAIAEFVDNSTASFFANERTLEFIGEDKLLVEIIYDSNAGTLMIKDNAFGMEINDFRRAILLNARPDNITGRNEFGMGLKTAASWFGKVWSVTSTQYGSANQYSATVDIPMLDREHKNEVDIVSSPVDVTEHGTTILIRDLNRKIEGGKAISKIKDILRSMYRRDLSTGKIRIEYNHQPLFFAPYTALNHDGIEWKKKVDYWFEFDGINHHVKGFVGILGGDDSGYKKAGFALFRRNRVVLGYEGNYYKPLGIFVEAQSPISHKLFGELDLDDFQINQAKDGFIWDDGLEDVFVETLKIQISDYIRMARKTIKSRENEFDPNDEAKIAETQQATQRSLDNLRTTSSTDSQEGETELEAEYRRAFIDGPDLPETVFEKTSSSYAVPIGRDYMNVTVTWTDAGSSYWFDYDAESKELKINIAHPFFKPFSASNDFRNVLNKFAIAIILAERRAEDSSTNPGYAYTDDINNFINEILKDLAK